MKTMPLLSVPAMFITTGPVVAPAGTIARNARGTPTGYACHYSIERDRAGSLRWPEVGPRNGDHSSSGT